MPIFQRNLTLSLFTMLILTTTAFGSGHDKPKEPEKPKTPEAKVETPIPKTVIYRALFKAQDIKIGKFPGCEGLVDNPSKRGTHEKNPTLGEWMSHILAQVKDLEKFYSVANCDIDKNAPKSDAEGRLCKVRFGQNSGNSVWSWGVNFRMKEDDFTLIKDSISCDAAG